MKNLAVKLINLYRFGGVDNLGYVFFGPIFGCRFHPTCSHYTEKSIQKYGIVRGVLRGIMRVARCNPLNKGGIDLP